MEQYLDARVKRYVQRRLFSKVEKAKTILGLAGTHPEKYKEVLPSHKKFIPVDLKPVNDSVIRNSIVGEFDLRTSQSAQRNPITFVDCDFCRSIVNCGDDLLYIYSKMKRSKVKNKYIAFTFSLRGVGEYPTLQWLKEHFPELGIIDRDCDLQLSLLPEVKEFLSHRQYVKQYTDKVNGRLDLFAYRDSGDNMISGIIKIAA